MQIYQVDAFTDAVFHGNPAAVIPLAAWLPDELLQNIAMENNLAETAFIVPHSPSQGAVQGNAQSDALRGEYQIRWFTPMVEVALCGHATLASGLVVFDYLGFQGDTIVFHSRKSGILKVSRQGAGAAASAERQNAGSRAANDPTAPGGAAAHGGQASSKLTLDFPANDPTPVDPLPLLFEALHIPPAPLYRGAHDYMVVLDNQQQIEALQPDMKGVARADSRGVVVTAPGEEVDFVSRCFFPQSGIDEDPVTGSAYTMMTPYWARRLGKTSLSAVQLSRRRGHLDCVLEGDRVFISGHAKIFLKGEVLI
jgi:predicted PhzF superfamily epimerase YddE/YHI9